MSNSKFISQLLGPTLVAMTVTERMAPHIWAGVAATQVYIAGCLWFVAGLSIVRIHNRWSLGWPILVTIMGWFALLGGLGRMAFPEAANQGAKNESFVFVAQMALLAVGVFITYMGYRRGDGGAAGA